MVLPDRMTRSAHVWDGFLVMFTGVTQGHGIPKGRPSLILLRFREVFRTGVYLCVEGVVVLPSRIGVGAVDMSFFLIHDGSANDFLQSYKKCANLCETYVFLHE